MTNDGNPPIEDRSELPPNSRIHVAESSGERIIIYIPPGDARTGILGYVALIWNGLLAVATAAWLMVWGPRVGMPRWVGDLFLCLLWGIGLHILYSWMRERFSQTFLLLEPGRFAIKRTLFRWTRLEEMHLGPDAKAEVIVTDEEDHDPIYSVAMAGTDRKTIFGTHLSHEEKLWIVGRINQFLGVDVPEWKKIRVEKITQPFSPEQLTVESGVRVLESTPERLLAQAPLFAKQIRAIYNPILIVVAAIWVVAVVSALALGVALAPDAEDKARATLILISVMLVIGFCPLLVAAAIVNATTTIELSSQFLRRRRHWGPLGISREVPTDSIVSVLVVTTEALPKSLKGFQKLPAKPMTHYTSCVVLTTQKVQLKLTAYQQRDTTEQIAGLVRHQLAQMQFQLRDN